MWKSGLFILIIKSGILIILSTKIYIGIHRLRMWQLINTLLLELYINIFYTLNNNLGSVYQYNFISFRHFNWYLYVL